MQSVSVKALLLLMLASPVLARTPPYLLDVGTMAPGDTAATEWLDMSHCDGVAMLAHGTGTDSMQIEIQYAIPTDTGGIWQWTHETISPPDSSVLGSYYHTNWDYAGRDQFHVDWEQSATFQTMTDSWYRRLILRNLSAVDTVTSVVIAQTCADGF